MSTPTLPADLVVGVPIRAEVGHAAQAEAERMAATAGGWPDWRTAHWTLDRDPALGPDLLMLACHVTVRPVAS